MATPTPRAASAQAEATVWVSTRTWGMTPALAKAASIWARELRPRLTDAGVSDASAQMLDRAGVKLIVAE